jgi:hypothetical protein
MCRIASLFLLQGLKGSMSGDARRAPPYATVTNWVAQFKRGDFSTCDASRPGRPKTLTTPEIIDQIHELIFEDRRISAKSIAEQLGIPRAGSIIHQDLDMRKLSAKWVPKGLNAYQKSQRYQSSEQFLTTQHTLQINKTRHDCKTSPETTVHKIEAYK